MDEEKLDRLERLFQAAQEQAPADREAFLDVACADDEDLRRELKSLLAADLDAERLAFLDGPPTGLLDFPQVIEPEVVPQTIGPYDIRRRIGRGGMGDVYLAIRNEPFRQSVALKVLRPGLDGGELRQRFEMEKQILASLNHPHIARILDGGATENGLPFIAMEFVEGKPLTTYCDEAQLSIAERLRLFQTVCEAVHYAHRNLIIHRDLKPSNILVTNEGEVKLLDFGIAKLLNPGLSPVTIPVTRELRLMTPEYSSPEQIRGDALATSTDVYSLGVVLYELLTGRGPYTLAQRTTEEIARAVNEQEPLRPSTRVRRWREARSNDVPPESGPLRRMSPDRLERKLRGDLDNIVMKALRKEPELRYLSCGQFAADVRRYLEGLTVEARPASIGYRMQKFVRRNRAAVAISSIAFALLIAFTISTTIQASLLRERSLQVSLEAQSAQAASDFLVNLFNVNNPLLGSRVDTLRLAEFVEMNVDRVRTELNGQPLLKARVLRTLGEVNRNLARYTEASALLNEALETQREAGETASEGMARTLYQLGELSVERGEYAEAESFHRSALDMNLSTAGRLAPLSAQILIGLAEALQGQTRVEEAEAAYLEALRMVTAANGAEHTTTALYHRQIGLFYQTIGSLDASHEHLTVARDLYGRLQGTESTDYAQSIALLAHIYRLQGEPARAVEYFQRALDIYEKNLGREYPYYPATLNDLALTYLLMRSFDEAEAAFREAIRLNTLTRGEGHHNTIANRLNLAILLSSRQQYAEAFELADGALRSWREIRPEDHWHVAVAQYTLGRILTGMDQYDEAEAQLLDSHRKLLAAFGPYHYQTRSATVDLFKLYYIEGDAANAARVEAMLRDRYETLRDSLGQAHYQTQAMARDLASLYEAVGDSTRAASFREAAP